MIGILSIVFCVFIMFQSCVVGLSNTISENGESGGSFGALIAIFMLVAGIVAIVTRKSDKKAGPVTCCVFYWISFLCSAIGAGSYADLKVWGNLAFIFGCVYLLAAMHGKKEIIVGIVVVDRDGIKVTIKEADNKESFWGADIYIYVENNTEKNVTVQADSTSINGFMVEPYFSCDVAAGKKPSILLHLWSQIWRKIILPALIIWRLSSMYMTQTVRKQYLTVRHPLLVLNRADIVLSE